MRVPQRDLVASSGATVPVPDPELLVHLQFRRFAGCPVCNLHLRTVVTRHDEIRAAGIREVVVFHSGVAELRGHVDDLPFDVIPDPDNSSTGSSASSRGGARCSIHGCGR